MRPRKIFLIGAGLVFAASLLGALVLSYVRFFPEEYGAATEQELAAIAAKAYGPAPSMQTVPEQLKPGLRVRLAIGSLGMPTEEQNRNVSDLALAELNGAKGLEMIDRQALEKVLGELRLSAAGLVRASDAVRAGKLLRADWFLLGTPATVNGANVAVVRLVDARTGATRDATMIPSTAGAQTFASKLTAFVRQSREDASNPKPKTYMAIGSFEDLSLNSRQAALPRELRSYLAAAYEGSGVTMLEREFVSILLQEMYLDLAGLTDESATNAPKPMLAAYWMVDGFYQSYETTNLQVELEINVHRVFGRNQSLQLREKTGESFFRSVKTNIDRVMAQDKAALVFSRLTEEKLLMQNGKALARFGGDDWPDYLWVDYEGYSAPLSESEMARRVRNAREAVRSFETVLLLDPTNREARICLASCFRKTLIERLDEARDYYRQVIDVPVEDRWSNIARQALVHSFEFPNPSESRLQWFQNAVKGTGNPAAVAFYNSQAKRAREDVTIQRGGTSEAERLAEERLFEKIKSFDSLVHTANGSDSPNIGMDEYAQALGNDRALVGRRLVELFPKMREQFPDLVPFLLASIVTFQMETNAPIFDEFERTLDWCVEHPDKIPSQGTTFWSHLRSSVYYWATDHHYDELALKVLETISRAAAVDPDARSCFASEPDRLEFAFCYMACQRWSNSLSIFETYSNRPIEMGGAGSWGPPRTVVLPNKQAAYCREKLGLPRVIDPHEFDLGEPCLHFHEPKRYFPMSGENPVVAAAPDGLWIGISGTLMRLDFDLHTNLSARMPFEATSPFSAIDVGSSKVWLGTRGSGLIEFDKTTQKIQHYTEKDGLLMDDVSALRVLGDTLWIGYGKEFGGGLGKLDLKTRTCTSFGASMYTDSAVTMPPRSPVTEIRPGPDGDIWFIANLTLARYRVAKNLWEALPNKEGVAVGCFETDGEHLIKSLGLAQLGLAIETIHGSERRLLDAGALPSVPTTLTFVEHDLWIGGLGFVALVDLQENKIKKIAYVSARSVDTIQRGGGYLWVQCDKHIYRMRL